MRVVIYDAVIQRNRRIAQASFLFSLAALLGAFLFGNALAGNDPNTAFYFQCGVLPTLFLVILFSVRMANNWIREPLPWDAIQEAVRGLSSNAILYHFVFPARHVLVAPTGVYVIYPLFQERPLKVKNNRWMMPGSLFTTIFTFMRQENIGDPFREAQAEAAIMQKVLDARFPENEIEVQPIIFFTSKRAKVVDIEGEPQVPITYAALEPTLKPFLKATREEDKVSLTPEQIETLEAEFVYMAGTQSEE